MPAAEKAALNPPRAAKPQMRTSGIDGNRVGFFNHAVLSVQLTVAQLPLHKRSRHLAQRGPQSRSS